MIWLSLCCSRALIHILCRFRKNPYPSHRGSFCFDNPPPSPLILLPRNFCFWAYFPLKHIGFWDLLPPPPTHPSHWKFLFLSILSFKTFWFLRPPSPYLSLLPGDLWRHCGGLGKEILMPYPINQRPPIQSVFESCNSFFIQTTQWQVFLLVDGESI